MRRIIFLDTETNNIRPGNIVEISAIETDSRLGVVAAYCDYFTVDFMSYGCEAVHGLSLERLRKLSNGLRFKDRAHFWQALTSDAIVIAHNAAFDANFLRAELERCDLSFKPVSIFCTMKYFTNILRIQKNRRYKWPRLSELIEFFNVNISAASKFAEKTFRTAIDGPHDAKFDVAALYLVFITYYKNRKSYKYI